jgi:hypothetical protein
MITVPPSDFRPPPDLPPPDIDLNGSSLHPPGAGPSHRQIAIADFPVGQ